MKKKLLTLVIAATMIVGTAVTAFAVDGNPTIVDIPSSSDSARSSVTIDGTISKADGTVPEGKVQVEVPTQMAFLVDKKGSIESTSYTVENKSASKVKVSVESFSKRDQVNGKIKLKRKGTDMQSLDRSNIQLYLVGQGDKVVDLGDFENNNNSGTELATINANSATTISLGGVAGKAEDPSGIDQTGASEQFDMIFKIEKTN